MAISLQQLQALVGGQGANQNLIYNRYQRSDYSVGQDNLNPQRELNLTDAEMWTDIENMRARLYDMYRERLEALRARAGTTANLPSDLGLAYDDREEIQVPFMLQESVTAHGGDHSPQEEIEKMLGALGGLLGSDIITEGDLPFDICAGIYDGYDLFDPTQYDDLRNRGAGGAAGDGGSGGSSGAGGGTAAGSGNAANAIAEDLQCFIQEVGLLKILLALIQIMQTAARIQQMVLTVVFMVVRAATLIAQAWVNPTAIAELVQELANGAVSWLAEGIQQIIKMIWDALDLDCLMQSSLSNIRGVMGNVAAVADVGAQAKSFLQINNQAIDEVQRSGAFIKDAFASRSLRDVLTDNGTLGDTLSNPLALVQNSPTMTALRSMEAVQKIRSAKAGLARAWTGGAEQAIDIASGIKSEIQQTRSHVAGATAAVTGAEANAARNRAEELNQRAAVGYYHEYDAEGNIEKTVQLSQREREQARTEAASLSEYAAKFEERQERAREQQQALDNDIDRIASEAARARDWAASPTTSTRRISRSSAALLDEADAVDAF